MRIADTDACSKRLAVGRRIIKKVKQTSQSSQKTNQTTQTNSKKPVTEHDDDHEPNPHNSTRFHSHARGTPLQPFLNLTLILFYINFYRFLEVCGGQEMFLDVSWSALELFYIELLIKIYQTRFCYVWQHAQHHTTFAPSNPLQLRKTSGCVLGWRQPQCQIS